MRSAGQVASEYNRLRPQLDRLEEEALFIVNGFLTSEGIKTHSVTSRVKALGSTVQKLRKPEFSPGSLDQLTDLVGLRVVALFLSDLPRIAHLVRSSFDVQFEDDKVGAAGSENAFGYMSHHFIVRLPETSSGARYDDLKSLPFEIQARTMLMDAWANVAHYLDYKGESSIPDDLQRDFYALSGLFYVADKHFEIFFDRSVASQEEAVAVVRSTDLRGVPLNLDTLQALLQKEYPDRVQSTRSALSSIVEELAYYDYATIEQVEQLLNEEDEWFRADERNAPPGDEEEDEIDPDPRYHTAGVVRRCLQHRVGPERWNRYNFQRLLELADDEEP